MTAKKKARKPKMLEIPIGPISALGYNEGEIRPWMVARDDYNMRFEAYEMRRIANWFTQAADFLDSRKKRT